MGVMERRRALMGMQGYTPPPGYMFIEYAENKDLYSTYVTLPYGFDQTDYLEIKGSLDELQGGEHWLVGSKTWNTNNNRLGMFGTSGGIICFCFGSQGTPNNLTIPRTVTDGDIHIMTYSDKIFRITDLNCVADMTTKTFGGETDKITLFRGYNVAKGKIYYFKQIRQNGDKVYILPVKNKTTGTVEMYDVISKTIMTRTGTLNAPE